MILLSFDIEEFDMPFEYHKEISFKDQMEISITGTEAILDILEGHQVKATFFSTVIFAQNAPATIQRILDQGHELASHGYYHSDFKVEHLLSSRLELEKIIQAPVTGYRMARMQPTDDMDIQNAGYEYNSSINPTWLPGSVQPQRKVMKRQPEQREPDERCYRSRNLQYFIRFKMGSR